MKQNLPPLNLSFCALFSLLFAVCTAIYSHALFAATPDSRAAKTEIILTDQHRSPVKIAKIDSENIELTSYVGLISIEDFDSSTLYGLRAALHLTEDVFIELSYGDAEGDKTSYEELSGGGALIADGDREYTFWDASFGWNIFSGEIWLFSKAFASNYYLMLGAGETEFGGDKWFTLNAATGYRLFLTDWLAMRIDARDHIFNRDLFGEDNQTHNIELSIGLSGYF